MVALSAAASGAVRREGVWPGIDKPVSLEARGMTRAQAIQKLAEAAGWSIVVHAPPGDPVDLHVKGQPASKVLEMLLTDTDYVAQRQGDLISISRDLKGATSAPAASTANLAVSATPTLPSAPSTAAQATEPAEPVESDAAQAPTSASSSTADREDDERGEDRVITGGSLRIEKSEIVHDVVMLGGSVEIFGNVTGDVVVTGGSVHLYDSSHVHGDVTALGGSIDVDQGARVDGDVGVVGGALNKADGAEIGGDIKKVGPKGKHNVHVSLTKPGDKPSLHRGMAGWSLSGLASDVGGALTRSALLFVFGAIFLALTTQRMESLQTEVAARPMRSFALGVVGGLAGAVLLTAMSVTLIGIPFALLCAIAGTIAAYVGICAVLSTVGGALLGHRTKNPYLHLALGCGLLLVLGSVPYVGGLLTAIVVLIGIGSVVATRGAGIFPSKAGPSSRHPYRTAATP
jgi:hypothetical protein